MRQKKNGRSQTAAMLMLAVPVIWLALRSAPYASGGLPEIFAHLSEISAQPFQITFCAESIRTVLVCLLIYGLGCIYFYATRHNYRRGEEHGSASWGDAAKLNRKYQQKPLERNRILTQNVRLGIHTQTHGRNLNTGVIGGTGAGKTRGYAMPNLLQANCSYAVTDPKGELLRSCGSFLERQGYRVVVLDLIHMDQSHCYNPFEYLENENDVQRLVTNFFRATGNKNGVSGDNQFWEDTAQMYLMAMIFLLLEQAPPEEQNFASVRELVTRDMVQDGDDMGMGAAEPSPLAALFYQIECERPDSIALKYYKDCHTSAGKTMKSIQISLLAHLNKFNLKAVADLTRVDELHLERMGEEKTALFCVIPDNDTSFNFLVSILYTQLFQMLFRSADDKYGGSLPIPVHFLLDEFANIALPSDFEKVLSVMRSRNISVSVILQALSQLKQLYKDSWEIILSNLDELLYLGSSEVSTHEYISKRLGKETIDTNSYGRSRGRSGSYSTNYQQTGRELLTPDEIGRMDNRQAILFIRGEKPVLDSKFVLEHHPNAKQMNAPPYRHGTVPLAEGTLTVLNQATTEQEQVELLSESEIEALFDFREESQHE